MTGRVGHRAWGAAGWGRRVPSEIPKENKRLRDTVRSEWSRVTPHLQLCVYTQTTEFGSCFEWTHRLLLCPLPSTVCPSGQKQTIHTPWGMGSKTRSVCTSLACCGRCLCPTVAPDRLGDRGGSGLGLSYLYIHRGLGPLAVLVNVYWWVNGTGSWKHTGMC